MVYTDLMLCDTNKRRYMNKKALLTQCTRCPKLERTTPPKVLPPVFRAHIENKYMVRSVVMARAIINMIVTVTPHRSKAYGIPKDPLLPMKVKIIAALLNPADPRRCSESKGGTMISSEALGASWELIELNPIDRNHRSNESGDSSRNMVDS